MTSPKNIEWKTEDTFLPSFDLPSTQGIRLGPRAFWQRRNLILVFLHDSQCRACGKVLDVLADIYQSVGRLNAEILVVIGGPEQAAHDLHTRIQAPFPFLFDIDGRVSALYLGDSGFYRPAMLVADRYGAIWNRLSPDKEDGPIEVQKTMKWLEFVEIQCPECDVPDSPSAWQMM